MLWDRILFRLYFDLINITEKYVGQDAIYDEFGSEDFSDLYFAMRPYFKKYKIDDKKIEALMKYTGKEHKKLKKAPVDYPHTSLFKKIFLRLQFQYKKISCYF